jgi:FkbM family methyltransferase
MTGSTLDRIHELIDAGEHDLATVEAIRAVDAWWPELDRSDLLRPATAEALTILGALREHAGDLHGASGAYAWALRAEPSLAGGEQRLHSARERLAAQRAAAVEPASAEPDQLNSWTANALAGLRRTVELGGREVLEIGGALPREAARELGVKRWVACELRVDEVVEDDYEIRVVDVSELPFADDSFDVVFSACAFEHFLDVPSVLAEARRVLRPGGVLYAEYGPIWTHAMGHHVYTYVDDELLCFTDPVVPNWAHLLLDRDQFRRYLSIARGDDGGTHVDWWVHESEQTNQLPEAEHRHAFWGSGLHVDRLEPHGTGHVPSPALQAELDAVHPDGSDFSTFMYHVTLSKPAPLDFRIGFDRTTPRSSVRPSVSIIVPTGLGPDMPRGLGRRDAGTELVLVHDRVGGQDGTRWTDDVRRVERKSADVLGSVAQALMASTGQLVWLVDPSDALTAHAVERLAGTLADDPQLVAAVAGWVPVDGHGLVGHGVRPEVLVPSPAVLDGLVVGDAHLLDRDRSPGMRSALLRRDVLVAALGDVQRETALLGRGVDLDALWLAVLARGPVANVPEALLHVRELASGARATAAAVRDLERFARGLGFLRDPWRDALATERALDDLLADDPRQRGLDLDAIVATSTHLQHLREQLAVASDAAGMRPVTAVLPVWSVAAEARSQLDALLACTQADLVDVLLVDASGGTARADLVAVGQELASRFDGDVALLDADRGSGVDELLAAAAAVTTTEFLLVLADPAALAPGWLVHAVARARTERSAVVADAAAALVARASIVAAADVPSTVKTPTSAAPTPPVVAVAPGPQGHDEVLTAGLALGAHVSSEDWRRVRYNLLGTDAETFECVRDGIRWYLSTADHISREVFATGGFQADEIAGVLRWLDAERPVAAHPLIVEVGANIGTTTVPFVRSGRRVLAIEPGPKMFALLSRTVEANGFGEVVTCVEAAVAREAAMAVLAIEPWNLGGSELVVDDKVSFLSGGTPSSFHEVRALPLDDVVRAHADVHDVAMVWSDAQGSEADVLESGVSLWDAGVPLYCEFWPTALDGHGGLERFLSGVEEHFSEFLDARELARGEVRWRPTSEVRELAARLRTLARDDSYTDLLLRSRASSGTAEEHAR